MNFINVATTMIGIWLDGTARAILMLKERFLPSRRVFIIEQDDGSFRLEYIESKTGKSRVEIFSGPLNDSLPEHLITLVEGARTELVLNSKRFLLRSLDLPGRAGDFLDGIIRSQIDRLTPWRADDAVFGYDATAAVEPGSNRINLTIAATAKSMIAPSIELLRRLKAQSIILSTRYERLDATMATIALSEQSGTIDGASHLHIRRGVRFVILAAMGFTVTTAVLTTIIGIVLGNKQAEISKRIAAERAAITAGPGLSGGAEAARHALEQRKRETPLGVIVLEVLSRTLPDDTYLTDLRIQGNKLQIVGMTRNAPALISLIEQSSYLDRAIFFAPTTRAPNEPRERFHIEAQINPVLIPRT